MTPILNHQHCQCNSSKKKFGLCDDAAQPGSPAYIDEYDGSAWVAVVQNEFLKTVTFTAIDNCIDLLREDRLMARRCDGVLTFEDTIVFVELKDQSGRKWIKEGEEQLVSTISRVVIPAAYIYREAYIANCKQPQFRSSQAQRMQRFRDETGFTLKIHNRIAIS